MTHLTTTAPYILLIEDAGEDCELLDMACRRAGLKVPWRIAGTLLESRFLLDELGPDDHPALVILDLRLPDGFSTALLPRLKADLPEVPIVIFSTSSQEDLIGATRTATTVDYLVKPDTLAGYSAIINRIRRALSRCSDERAP